MFYKKDIYEQCKFFKNDDTVIFGDSGGFQIATGAMKWDVTVRRDIMDWLENNSTVAANIDIPPYSKLFSYDDAKTMSYDNFKYFHDNQRGSTKFLNVIQGDSVPKYLDWYQSIKEFTEFHGWCVGNCNSLSNLINALLVLLTHREHLRSKVFHFFGASDPTSFIICSHIQNAFNDLGIDIKIYCDSSSPNSARFGNYYTGINLKNQTWNSVHIPYLREVDANASNSLFTEIANTSFENSLPLITDFDKNYFKNLINSDDLLQFSNRFLSAMMLRNIYVFKYQVELINHITTLPEYYRRDIFNTNLATIGTLVHELIINSDSANELKRIYSKLTPLLKDFTTKSTGSEIIRHDFF